MGDLTFNRLTERFMQAPEGQAAFQQLRRDALKLCEIDSNNSAIYSGVARIAGVQLRAMPMSVEGATVAKKAVMNACFTLVTALTCGPELRATTLAKVMADFKMTSRPSAS